MPKDTEITILYQIFHGKKPHLRIDRATILGKPTNPGVFYEMQSYR